MFGVSITPGVALIAGAVVLFFFNMWIDDYLSDRDARWVFYVLMAIDIVCFLVGLALGGLNGATYVGG